MALVCKYGNKECDGCMRCFDNEVKPDDVVCSICGQPITDKYYEIDDLVYCEECMQDEFTRYI